MGSYPAGLVDLIDARLNAVRIKTRSVGTFVGMDSGYAMVAFDGSSIALPCKFLADVSLSYNARVTVDMYGSDWVVTGQLSSPWPIFSSDYTALTGFTNTAATEGSPVVEVQFDAPPSGAVFITVGGHITQGNTTNMTALSYRVVQGNDYASGVEVQSFDYRIGIACGRAVNTSASAVLSGATRWPLVGLVPGAHYVARTGHWVNPAGSGTALARLLMAEPVA